MGNKGKNKIGRAASGPQENKKRTRGFYALLVTFCLCAAMPLGAAALSGCGGLKEFVFLAPDGGTLLPAAKLFCDAPEIPGYRVKGEAVSGTAVEARLLAGTCDAAIAPINLCARAYNTGGNYALAGVAAWGNNYIVAIGEGASGGEQAPELGDLYGEVLYAFGAAAVPGVTLKAVLEKKGVAYEAVTSPEGAKPDRLNVLFLPAAADIILQINRPDSPVRYAYLPEPNVTALTAGGANGIIFDIQELWEEETGQRYPQAGLVIKKSLLESAPGAVTAFLTKMEESAAFCLANPAESARLAKESLQSAALPSLALTQKYIEGNGRQIMAYGSVNDAEVRASVAAYLAVIMGDNAPDEGFYF